MAYYTITTNAGSASGIPRLSDMDPVAVWAAAVATTGVLVSLYFARRASRKSDEKDLRDDAGDMRDLKNELQYISRGVDDIRIELRAQREQMSQLAERVTRVEESAKQAHKRLDAMERRDQFD